MNSIISSRLSGGWKRGPQIVDMPDGSLGLSVVFSWDVPKARAIIDKYAKEGIKLTVGGPAARLMGYETGHRPDTVSVFNPRATFTSKGCIRKCPFCIVPVVEGSLVEIDDFIPRPIVCDNNILATSWKHFVSVIESLIPISIDEVVDFNQGLDARLLTVYHVRQLTRLNRLKARLAWDNSADEKHFRRAFYLLTDNGIKPRNIHVFVLIGFNDDPGDALYRLRTVWEMGAWPNPMRYQPIDSTGKNEYVSSQWTNQELVRYMRYWSNLRYLSKIPFEEFRYPYRGDGQ